MNRQDKLRLIAASAILVAVPCYVICGLNHLCMDGHMEHPPYPSIDWLNDAAWVAAMVLSAAAGWKSNLTFKRSVLTGMILLLVSRLVLGSGGSFLFLLELPVVFAVTFTALFGFFFRDIDKSGLTSEQRRTHRRRIPRNWVGTLATLTIVLLSCYATIRIRDFIRVKSAPRIAITGNAIPFTREIILEPGKAVVLILPNDKTLAIWCEKPDGFGLSSGFDMRYGEQPFTRLEYEKIPLPDGGFTSGDLLSYIRQGPVMDGGSNKPSEYILYVNPYRISLKQQDIASNIRLLATVSHASEEEQVSQKNEVDYFVGQLQNPDPASRTDAVRKLAELVYCGATYATPRRAFIIDQLKGLANDASPQVRAIVAESRRQIGDPDSLLQILQPQPAGKFLNAEAAWELGSNTKQCKDPTALAPVYQHMLTFFKSDQEELREFAVIFFSHTEPVPEAREFLIQARHDPAASVRAAAAQALDNLYDGNLHDDDPDNDFEARDIAINMLADPAPEVIIAALVNSVYHGENRQLPFTTIDPYLGNNHKGIRLAAITATHFETSAPCRQRLLEITRDPDPDIRAAAAESLYPAGSKAVGERMVELLQDDDTTVRIRALQALDGGRHKFAVPAIKDLLASEKDPDVIRVAKDTLSKM